MKKQILLLLSSVVFSVASFGQSMSAQDNCSKTQPSISSLQAKIDAAAKNKLYNQSGDRSLSRWYGYYEAIDSTISNQTGARTGVINVNTMFPDSTINAIYGDGMGGTLAASVWIHNLADLVDPTSLIFNNPVIYPGAMAITKNDAYTLDSIGMWVIYVRNTNASVVDTMVIDLISNNTAANMPTAYFTGTVAANLLTDTVFIKNLGYDFNTNKITGTGRITMKIPLDATFYADSVFDGIYYVQKAVSGFAGLGAGKIIACSYSFIPGYSWIPYVDTVSNFNYFRFYSKEENGAASYPTYTKRDWNISYLLPTDVRYNNAGGWNGHFIPSFAYMGSTPNYAYEHYLIDYKLSCSTCNPLGTNTIAASKNEMTISPNPSAENSNVSVSLKSNADCAIQLFDVTGKFVANLFVGNLNAGTHNFNLNSAALESGVYFITMKTNNGEPMTTKFVVAH